MFCLFSFGRFRLVIMIVLNYAPAIETPISLRAFCKKLKQERKKKSRTVFVQSCYVSISSLHASHELPSTSKQTQNAYIISLDIYDLECNVSYAFFMSSFWLEDSAVASSIAQLNESKRWTFSRIWFWDFYLISLPWCFESCIVFGVKGLKNHAGMLRTHQFVRCWWSHLISLRSSSFPGDSHRVGWYAFCQQSTSWRATVHIKRTVYELKHNDQAQTQTRREKKEKLSILHRFVAIIYSPFPSAYRFRMFHWQSMENMFDVTRLRNNIFLFFSFFFRFRCLIEEEKTRMLYELDESLTTFSASKLVHWDYSFCLD